MAWIKRNLYFVVGGGVALILMGLAGFYLYSKWQRNNEAMQKLEADFSELQRLNNENPHPGSKKIDNIAEAQAHQKQYRDFIAKMRQHFVPIPPIPQTPEFPKVSDRDFSAALSRTRDQLQRAANSTSVTLPPAYSFSFEAQNNRLTLAPGSASMLAVQLGEVKAIVDVLVAAKVNSIDGIRRERVSPDDMTGPQTDYLDQKSVTNELAVLTPYEVTFRCFSSELAAVLGGFAASPHGLLVKSLNVEPAAGTNYLMDPNMPGYGGYPGIMPGPSAAEAEMSRRYGLPPTPPVIPRTPPVVNPEAGLGGNRYGTIGGPSAGVGLAPSGGVPLRPLGEPGTVQPRQPVYQTYQPTYQPGVAATPRPGALQTVLDEKQLRVTMNLVVVKPIPPATQK
jgi:hypothetical protein